MRTCGPARALMLELWRKNLKFAIADECCFCNLLAGLASLKVTSATEGGYRIVAVRQFSKLSAGVRFPLPAPQSNFLQICRPFRWRHTVPPKQIAPTNPLPPPPPPRPPPPPPRGARRPTLSIQFFFFF